MQVKYQVVIDGVSNSVSSPDKTISAFAKVLKVTEEKAHKLLAKKRVIKKGLEKHQAELMSRKLNAIGVAASIMKEEPMVKDELPSKSHASKVNLELVPIAEPEKKTDEEKSPPQMPKTSAESLTANHSDSMMQTNDSIQDQGATISSGNIRHQERTKSGILSIEFIEDVTLLGIIITCIVAVVAAILWSNTSISNSSEFNWLAVAVGGAIGITMLVVGGSSISSGFLSMGLAIAAIILARHLMIAGVMVNALDSSDNELRGLLERRQSLLQDYDFSMDDNDFFSFYRNFTGGPTDIKYNNQNRGTKQQIIEMRPYFEKMIPEILNMTYEEIAPQIEEVGKKGFEEIKKVSFDFFGVDFLIWLTFGSIIALRFGMGFGR